MPVRHPRARRGQYQSELRPVETSLEDAFFALTDQLGGT
jgi:hypothetical protein